VPISPDPERAAIKRLANEYARKGYEVIIGPEPGDLPPALANYRVDLLAKRGDEVIIVDVKTRRTLHDKPDLRGLARAVRDLPGWRLELVVTNPRHKRVAPDDAVLPGPAALAKRLEEAEGLAKAKHLEAAFLLAWSAAEGILRTVAEHEGVEAASDSPASILKRLYSLGLIAKTSYGEFQRRLDNRNAVIHGFALRNLDYDALKRFMALTRSMMSGFRYLDPNETSDDD
jgi:hypothetical protein